MRVPILILLSVAALLGACGAKQHDARLLSIEEIIEEHPDSALALIGRTDSLSINSRADIALYGLLYVQARTKCDYTECTDALIAPAITYFREKGDKERLMKALFYGATTAYNRRELNESVVRGMESHEIAASLADDYWRAKAAELLGDVFQKSFLYSEGLKYRKEAVEYYKSAGKERNHRFAICDYINDLFNKDSNTSIAPLDSIARIALTEPVDSDLLYYSTSSIFNILISTHQYTKAKDYYNTLDTFTHIHPYILDYVNCATLCVWLGDYDKAANYLKSAEKIATFNADHAVIANCYSYLYKQLGQFDKALARTEAVLDMQNKELRRVFAQSAVVAQRDLFEKQALNERHRAARHIYLFVSAAALAVVLIAWGANHYRLRLRLKNAELERNINRILHLQHELNSANTLTQQSRQCIVQAYGSHWTTLRKISDRLQDMPDKYKGYHGIMKQLRAEMAAATESQRVAEIVQHIDKLHDGIISRMRAEIPSMTDTDAATAAMMLARIDVRTMSLLLDINPNTLYSRRRRFMESAAGCDALEAFKSHLAASE